MSCNPLYNYQKTSYIEILFSKTLKKIREVAVKNLKLFNSIYVIFLFFLLACGGGGKPSSGPTVPPPIAKFELSASNAEAIISQAFVLGETILHSSHLVMKVVNDSLKNTTNRDWDGCSTGTANITIEDNDLNNQLSAGDSMLITFTDCFPSNIEGKVTGNVSLIVDKITFGRYGEPRIYTSTRFEQGFVVADEPVTGELNISAEITLKEFVIKASAINNKSVQINNDVMSQFNVVRSVIYTATNYKYGYQFSMNVNSSLGGRAYSCRAPSETTGLTGRQRYVPYGGEFICQGETGPIVKYVPSGITNTLSYSLLFDYDRNNNFVLSDHTVKTYGSLKGYLWEIHRMQTQIPETLHFVNTRKLTLDSNRLVVNAVTGMAYATIAGSDSNYANSVVKIDPRTGTVVDSIQLNYEPGALSISKNSDLLYLAYDRHNVIEVIDLNTFSIQSSISLGQSPTPGRGKYFAQDIEASPTNNLNLAITIHVEDLCGGCDQILRFAGQVMLRNGQMDSSFAGGSVNNIIFGATESTIYGTNTIDTGYELSKLNVTTTAMTLQSQLSGFSPGGVVIFNNGLLLSNLGDVINFENEKLVGSFEPVFEFSKKRDVVFASNLDSAVYLFRSILEVYDPTTYNYKASYLVDIQGTAHSISELGSELLIIATEQQVVFIDKTNLLQNYSKQCLIKNIEEFRSGVTYSGMDCAVGDIAYDSLRNLVYVTVKGRQGEFGNRLYAFNADTMALVKSIYLGSNPGDVALAKDMSRIYIALDGTAEMLEVDLNQFVVTRKFSFGRDSLNGPLFAEDFEVSPINPEQVLVATYNRYVSARHSGILTMTRGLLDPLYTSRMDHILLNQIEFNSDNQAIGINNETTEFALRELSVTESGVSVDRIVTEPIGYFGVKFKLANGVIYFSNGQVFDLISENETAAFDFNGNGRRNLLDVSVEENRLYAYTDMLYGQQKVETYDLNSRERLDEIRLPLQGNLLNPEKIISMGNGKIIVASGDRLLVIETP